MNKMFLKYKPWLEKVICFLAVIAFVVYAGHYLEAWTGFPKGVDVYARMTRVKFILDFFPHVNWQYHWANGLPTFTTEGAFFYYLAAFLVKVTGISIETSMIVLGFLAFSFLGVGVCGYVYNLTNRFEASLAAVFLILSSFSVWSWMVWGGIYPRIFAVGLMSISLWLLAKLLRKKEIDLSRRLNLVALILTLSALLLTHIMIAFFTFMAISLHLFFSSLSKSQKLELAVKLFGSSLAISAVIYLPLLIGISSSSGKFLGVISQVVPLSFTALWDQGEIGWMIFPIFIISLLISFIWQKKRGEIYSLIWPSLLMLIFFSLYAFIGYSGLSGKYYYINGFIPASAALFISFFASIVSGVLLGKILDGAGKIRFLALFLIIAVLLGTIAVIPINAEWQKKFHDKFNRTFVSNSDDPRSTIKSTQQMSGLPKQEFQYRFAPFDALEAVWFNYEYQTPQERDYYGQGILHVDWRYWFEQALWNPKFSPEETGMALDWFAVKWFSEYIPNLGPVRPIADVLKEFPSRYMDNPLDKFTGQFAFIDWALLLRFENLNPAPIMSVTNSIPVLLIGQETGYDMFFRNLALININSQKLIPLLGKEYIDDYKLSDLKYFKTLILYDYKYHNKKTAFKLLQDYVGGGGNLIWELTGSPDEGGTLAEPAPFTQVKKESVKKDWDYLTTSEPFAAEINFSIFSPLDYEGGSWKLSSASSNDLRSGAKGLIGKDNQWIAAVGEYGKGKVLLTGFNFLYHMNAHKNLEEVKLLAKIVDFMGLSEVAQKVDFQTQFVNPEKRIVEIANPAKGVLFKENFYSKWHAYLEGKGEQHIYYAGPGMMYVVLPAGAAYPAKLTFEYKQTLIETVGIIISLLALGSLGFYLIKGRLPIKTNLFKFTTGWWDKDEE